MCKLPYAAKRSYLSLTFMEPKRSIVLTKSYYRQTDPNHVLTPYFSNSEWSVQDFHSKVCVSYMHAICPAHLILPTILIITQIMGHVIIVLFPLSCHFIHLTGFKYYKESNVS
jgi:hypothetical protein